MLEPSSYMYVPWLLSVHWPRRLRISWPSSDSWVACKKISIFSRLGKGGRLVVRFCPVMVVSRKAHLRLKFKYGDATL